MPNELFQKIREAEAALRQGDSSKAKLALARARSMASRASRTTAALQGDVDRYRLLMERTLQVTLAQGLELVAEQILDGMLTIVQARRGFVGLVEGSRWRFLVARNLEQADIHNPDAHVSTSIISEAIESRAPVITDDAASGGEFSDQASVHQLQLRSVACLPLTEDGRRVIGFVYLDDPGTQGLFDDAALATVQSWLPVVSGCVSRALAEQPAAEPLKGVVTRAPRMHEALQELGRIARFNVSVLLTGETGTGKSLTARALHQASDRAAGPFVHVNCGAIPEALIESELFGHKKGAFTGATADKIGKIEAANGGTLFLDELDSMPLSCQVKLLVVLQERTLQRVGDHRDVPIDVRVVAAMGSDPFDAIDEDRLREDLYYRLAVVVAPLPPLRARKEDIPLLTSHFLELTRAQYNLPPLRLSDAALDTLLSHNWPGNVRELRNVLDRAALLARDGLIEQIQIRGRRRREDAPAGLVERLERTARHMVEVLDKHPELRVVETADTFRSAVILEAARSQGSREAGFRWLGMESLVRNRNHHRAFKREASRLQQLGEALGETVNPALLSTD